MPTHGGQHGYSIFWKRVATTEIAVQFDASAATIFLLVTCWTKDYYYFLFAIEWDPFLMV